jgi:lysophospholipase L1-like esterase
MRVFLVLGLWFLTAGPAFAQGALKIVCLGDSVTKAVRPGVKVDETFVVVLQTKLQAANQKAEVLNFGIGGQTTEHGVARLGDVLATKPTHVVVMYGLNDSWIDKDKTAPRLTPAEYSANLKKIIDRLKREKVMPLLMTPNPVAAPKYTPDRNANLKKYVEAVRKLARDENVTLIDVYARYAELALEGTDLNILFTDAMHPNPKGQALIADWLFEELRPL